MREKFHSIKMSFLFIVMVVRTLGIVELSPWTSIVLHILGALWKIGITSFIVRLYDCNVSYVDFNFRKPLSF
jgi:hypothetical protein